MAGQRVLYGCVGSGGSNGVLRAPPPPSSKEPLNSLFLSGSTSPLFGLRSMVSFEDVNQEKGSERSFFRSFDQDDNGDEDFDEYFHQPEKKRRLTADQVQFLERSFEVENKLEPERKIQLAKELGLQPRQIAIWFQNRRARWKTKQLEKDFEALQTSYNGLKADYENLLEEKEKLKAEVLCLTDKLIVQEKERGNVQSCISQKLPEAPATEPTADLVSEDGVSKLSAVALKQEDLSSAKSDVLDSESPHYADGVHSSLLEQGDSSYVFEPDQSDLSQDEEDNFSKNFWQPAHVFPKNEDADYRTPPAYPCHFGFPVEDQAFGFWSY